MTFCIIINAKCLKFKKLIYNQKVIVFLPTKCNTDKTAQYTCDVKVKTCGLLLACTPCGIILNVKEFYGAESCPQVALFYLETRKNIEGFNIFYIALRLSFPFSNNSSIKGDIPISVVVFNPGWGYLGLNHI